MAIHGTARYRPKTRSRQCANRGQQLPAHIRFRTESFRLEKFGHGPCSSLPPHDGGMRPTILSIAAADCDRRHSAPRGDALSGGPQRPHTMRRTWSSISTKERHHEISSIRRLRASFRWSCIRPLAVCDSHQKCDCDVSGGWTILHDNGAKATLSVAQREQGFLEGAHIRKGAIAGTCSGEGQVVDMWFSQSIGAINTKADMKER